MRRPLFWVWLISLWSAAFGVWAQSPLEQRNAKPGVFDFYVLALSWSPGFCELTNRRNKDQCGPDNGNGFVVHGLWPQFTSGYPSECANDRRPSRAAVSAAVPPFPTEGLARYEWRKHGSCSGLDPTAYFAAARTAFGKVALPDQFSQVSEDTKFTPVEIERAFSESNTGLRADMMSVQCRKGVFEEIRICLSKDLRTFISCPEVDSDSCRGGGSIRVEAMDAVE